MNLKSKIATELTFQLRKKNFQIYLEKNSKKFKNQCVITTEVSDTFSISQGESSRTRSFLTKKLSSLGKSSISVLITTQVWLNQFAIFS